MAGQFFARVRRTCAAWVLGLIMAAAPAAGASAQDTPAAGQQDLRSRIERQYEILPLRDGVLLKSRSARPVRSVQLSDGKIAIDGIEVTGAEVRQQLGVDADLVLQLSYLNSTAQHTLFGFGSAAPGASPPAPGPIERVDRVPQRRVTRGGTSVRFGGDVNVGPDETRTDDVVVFGGTARIDGGVEGDVVVIGGGVELGPQAHVTGDVTSIGGSLQRAPGAVVDGDVNEVGSGSTGFGRSRGRGRRAAARFWPFAAMPPFARLAATGLRTTALILLASVLILVARKPIERIGIRAAAEPVKAGLIGLLLEVLFIPVLVVTVVLLAVSIIGIPLLALVPFALLAAALVLVVGFTAVAYRVGGWAATRFGWPESPYLATLVGIVVVFGPLLLARVLGVALGGLAIVTMPLAVIGWFVEFAAWTIGLGAAALDRFRPAPSPQMLQTSEG